MKEIKKTCENCYKEEVCDHSEADETGGCDVWGPDKDAVREIETWLKDA